MPSDVCGHAVYDPKSERFTIRRGPIFTNLLLADEINRAPAKTQSALLEAMQEQQVTIEGGSQFELPAPFMTLATQNPVEQEGTYPLPEAQLDRFLLKVLIGYPSHAGRGEAHGRLRSAPAAAAARLRPLAGAPACSTAERDRGDAARHRAGSPWMNRRDRLRRADRRRDAQVARHRAGRRPARQPRAGTRCARAGGAVRVATSSRPTTSATIAKPALRHRIALSPEMQIEGQSTGPGARTRCSPRSKRRVNEAASGRPS